MIDLACASCDTASGPLPSATAVRLRELLETVRRLGYAGGAIEYETTLPLRQKDTCKWPALLSGDERAGAGAGAGPAAAGGALDLAAAASVSIARRGGGPQGAALRLRDATKLAALGAKRAREVEGGAGGGGATAPPPPLPWVQLSRITIALDPCVATGGAGAGAPSAPSATAALTAQLHPPPGSPASVVLASYDVVAVVPVDAGGLRAAIAAGAGGAVDIITLDMSAGRLPFPLAAADIAAALDAGISFELRYAPAIRDASARRFFFANARTLHRLTRGRGILLASAAHTLLEVRSPDDAAAIVGLAGLSRDAARRALSAAPAAALAHAKRRRGGGVSVSGVPPPRR